MHARSVAQRSAQMHTRTQVCSEIIEQRGIVGSLCVLLDDDHTDLQRHVAQCIALLAATDAELLIEVLDDAQATQRLRQ